MAKHRKTRREKRKQKKLIVISALSLLLLITVGYAAFSTNLSITAKGNIKEKSRVIQAWEQSSQTDFHSDFYRQNIVSATFLDNNNVPSNATESWNVSEDKENGEVMAWVVPNNNDNTKYDLYIGAKGGVIANEDSKHILSYFVNLKLIEFNNNFDTSNVINMQAMFYNCISLVELDLSSFNTSKVTSLSALLSMYNHPNTSLLTKVNLSGWNTSNVINMRDMFAYNPNLTTIIGIENFDTANVTNMHGVFFSDKKITNLDLSHWNTEKVTSMYSMFSHCSSLTTLDLCSFNTKNTTNMNSMFYSTTSLINIYVGPKWETSQADTTNMFSNSGVSSVTTGQC